VLSCEFQSTCLALRLPAIKIGHPPRKTGAEVRSDQWAGRGELSRKFSHRFAGHCDLDGGSLQLGLARKEHCMVNYTTADQNGCTAPSCRFVCAVADIIGKLEGLAWFEECLT
jgi:hypothetical protein